MKKLIFAFVIGIAFAFTTIQSVDNCDKQALSASCRKKMDPFKYDSQKFTKIVFSKKAQQMEVEVPVFVGEKYRLVFNTSALPKPIKVNVYTKDKDAGKREAIFTTKAGDPEQSFDVPRVRKLFVDYDVPADSTNSKSSGCMVFMVGYK